jgi:hypothetical protein
MKKIVLSTIATLLIATTSLSATQFYVNDDGQVFINPGQGRTALDMSNITETKKAVSISKEEKAEIREEIKKEVLAEVKKDAPKSSFSRITIMDKNSPDFLLGKQTHINMKFVPEDNPDMWLKVGVRVQGTMENKSTDYKGSGKVDTDINDAYLRRVRLEIAAGFGHGLSFVMDIRNDKSNYGIENEEGDFNVGDAYLKIKKPFDTSLVNFKLYRAKIDISRTETVKSARVIAYDRPYVADIAAQYISFNRRGANIQMYGDYKKKFHYQVAFGSATSPSKIKDASNGKTVPDIDGSDASFFYGGKIRLSPFDGWEETKRTESYFGVGKHFSIGAGYWVVPEMKGEVTDKNGVTKAYDLEHKLINLEASMHYKGLFLQAEYFKFEDFVEDWNAVILNTGDSSGWYVTGEYVMPDLGYIAPFFRYEDHDRFEDADDATVTSKMAGINWYLKGNTIKAGIYYQKDNYGVDAAANSGFEKDVEYIRLTSQFFF